MAGGILPEMTHSNKSIGTLGVSRYSVPLLINAEGRLGGRCFEGDDQLDVG